MSDEPVDLQRLIAIIDAQQQSIDRLVRLLETAERARADGETAKAGDPKDGDPKKEQKPKPRPVDWLGVNGRERLVAWQRLSQFVEALVFRYNLQLVVRPCWWRHPEAVEELTGIWHMYQASYGEDSGLKDAMSWVDTLHKCFDRLRPMFTPCRERHVDAQMSARVWMTDEIRGEFYDAVRRDVLDSQPPSG